MNAGGVSKACKSNARFEIISRTVSGRRERNTLVTCLEVVNTPAKAELIHDTDGGTSVIPIESFGASRGAYGLSACW